ncbi:MAG: hypothetical protein BRC29_04110 [Nanohaloarchaea archaeon SW_7_43_1]|nr:MAG: hypothetical protein BRC29_04110 [Nanohaloarchaea archaeon SW_7_43_1]
MKDEHTLGKIDLTDDFYTVTQNLVRNKYTVKNSDGEEILQAKQKMFKMKEEFPFTDPDGNTVFTVKAERRLDIAGDYGVVDEETGENIVTLEKEFSILTHNWKIKDPEKDTLMATIESRGRIMGLLRSLMSLLEFLPHKYTIYNSDRDEIGEIREKFSLKDRYEIEIGELGKIPREAIIAAAISVDALEGE